MKSQIPEPTFIAEFNLGKLSYEDGTGEKFTARVIIRPIQSPDTSSTVEHCPTDASMECVSFTSEGRRAYRSGVVANMADGGGANLHGVCRDLADALDAKLGKLDVAELRELAALAERWHLNEMRGACAHQAVVYDVSRRLVPSLTLTLPCEASGYRYGSAWLVEPLPSEVRERIVQLCEKAL